MISFEEAMVVLAGGAKASVDRGEDGPSVMLEVTYQGRTFMRRTPIDEADAKDETLLKAIANATLKSFARAAARGDLEA